MNEYDQLKLMMIINQDDLKMFPAFHQMKQLVEQTELEHPAMDGSQLLRKMEKELSVISLDLQAQKADFYQTAMDSLLDSLAKLEGSSDEQAFLYLVANDIQTQIKTIKLENPDVTADKIFDVLAESGALKTLISVLEQRLVHAKEYTSRLDSHTLDLRRQARRIHIRGALVTVAVAASGTGVMNLFQHMPPKVLVLALLIDVLGGIAYYIYLRLSYKRLIARAVKKVMTPEKPN
jgi:hypothetical protein